MKNLLYKEFSLVMSPLVYILCILFGLFPLIPSFPVAASYFYMLSVFPMLFLGANKGTQTNDVYFSLTLPCKRKDVVAARLVTVNFCQILTILVTCITSPIGDMIRAGIPQDPSAGEVVIGLGTSGMMALIAYSLISFSLMNLIFFALYYKDAKRFGVPYLFSAIPFAIVLAVFTIALPAGVPAFNNIFGKWNPIIQPITLIAGLLIAGAINYLAYKLGSKRFEKADF